MVYDIRHPLQSALTCNSTKILSLASKLYELHSKGISNDLTCLPVLWYVLSTFMKCDSNRSDMSPWYEMFLELFWNALKWSDMPLPTHTLEMFFQLFWNALKWWCDMQWGEASFGKVSFLLWPWWVRSGNIQLIPSHPYSFHCRCNMELDMLAVVVVLTFENILFNKCVKLVPLFFKPKWLHLLQLITHLLTVNVNVRFTIDRRRQGSPHRTIDRHFKDRLWKKNCSK